MQLDLACVGAGILRKGAPREGTIGAFGVSLANREGRDKQVQLCEESSRKVQRKGHHHEDGAIEWARATLHVQKTSCAFVRMYCRRDRACMPTSIS